MKPAQWRDLEAFLLSERDLAPSTTDKTLRFVRTLQENGVNPARPSRRRYNEFIAHRKMTGQDGPGIRHYGRAMQHLLAWNDLVWPNFKLPRCPTQRRDLMPDPVVERLLNFDTGRDELETQAARFAFRFGFYVTRRPPSEHLAVKLQHFDRRHGRIRVWSEKLDKWVTKELEPWLVLEIADYIDGFRDQVAKRGETALLLDPYTGRAWPTPSAYGMWLGRVGRGVYAPFRPYDLRHAGATWRLLQWNFKILWLRDWLDHVNIQSTMVYVHLAEEIRDRHQRAAMIQPYRAGALA